MTGRYQSIAMDGMSERGNEKEGLQAQKERVNLHVEDYNQTEAKRDATSDATTIDNKYRKSWMPPEFRNNMLTKRNKWSIFSGRFCSAAMGKEGK